MAKRGRQPMYTQERVAKICKAIENGETNANAAKIGGIHVATFCEWQKTKPEFAEAVKRAKAAFEDWQLNGILDDAKKSLKTLICGQEYEEIKTEYENDKNGDPRIRKQTRVTKKVLPNPTAENLAKWITEQIPECYKVEIMESENNLAIYEISD